MTKTNKKRKINLNFGNTVLILGATLLLFVVLIIAFYVRSNQVTETEVVIDNLIQQGDNSNSAKPNDFSGAYKLLQVLPYGTKDFTANYVALEKDSKPVIIVNLLTDDGQTKFNEWLQGVVFDPQSVEFEYLSQPVYEVFQ